MSACILHLLCNRAETYFSQKNDLSGEVDKQFNTYVDYYVFSKNKIQRLKKEKDFILKIVSLKKDKFEEFIKEHSIDFKNINDIIILLNFYNSLFFH